MIKSFKIFEQSNDKNYGQIAKNYCEKALKLLKPFNLSEFNDDNKGNPEFMYKKFKNIKSIFIENFPEFELEEKQSGGNDVNKYPFYQEFRFKNKTLLFYFFIVNEGESGQIRMRVWIGSKGRVVGRKRIDIFGEKQILDDTVGNWWIGAMGRRLNNVKWDEIGSDFAYGQFETFSSDIDPFGEENWAPTYKK